MIARQKIRDTARGIFFRNKEGNELTFELNKQVAFVGKVNFTEENHPLGNIEVKIEDENLENLIDDLTRVEQIIGT